MLLAPTHENLLRVVEHLRQGHLAAIPTETVYGLAADAMNPEAIKKIYQLKNRPASNPLIVHIAHAEQLHDWAENIPEITWALAEAFWPGPLTLVLPKKAHIPDIVTGGQNTVALRIPSHPIALEILKLFKGGLAAPSANPYTRISPTTALHVASYFSEDLWIVDGGPTTVGIESTIVACQQDKLILLRQGMISGAQLHEATSLPIITQSEGIKAPGQAALHYAPLKPLQIVDTSLIEEACQKDHTPIIGLIHYSNFISLPKHWQAQQLTLSPEVYAKNLYQLLHQLEASNCEMIWIEAPPHETAYEAIYDRLGRAAN